MNHGALRDERDDARLAATLGTAQRSTSEDLPQQLGPPSPCFAHREWLALVACMRKLLTILNTMVRSRQRWSADHISSALIPA